MPIYEYTCCQCGSEFEWLVRGSEPPICPECGGGQLDRRLSLPAAPVTASRELPIRPSPPGMGCGRPECGGGRCAMSDDGSR